MTDDIAPAEQTEPADPHELELSLQWRRRIWHGTLVALIVTVLIGLVVIVVVPWDTTVRYERASRSGDLPLLVLAGAPALLGFIALKERTSTKPLRRWEFWASIVALLAMIGVQLVFAQGFFASAATGA